MPDDAKLRKQLTQRLHFALTQRGTTGMCIDETGGMVWNHEYHAQPRRIVHATKTATWEHVLSDVAYASVERVVDRMCKLSKIRRRK
jgi:hypothetical protein